MQLHLVLNEAVPYQTQVAMDVYEFFELYTAWKPILDARHEQHEKNKYK